MKLGLVVLDTLRHDVAASELSSLRALADHTFENAYSTSRWTVPAHASLFTGRYPSEVGTNAEDRSLTTPLSTLAERFATAGYATRGYSNNVYVDSLFGFDRGFETFTRGPAVEGRPVDGHDVDWHSFFQRLPDGRTRYPTALARLVRSDAPTLPALRTAVEFLRSDAFVEQTNDLTWIQHAFEGLADAPPSDLFLFANLMTTHFPYAPPADYRSVEPCETPPLELALREEPVTPEEHRRHWECYRGAARYLDDVLPELLERIDWDLLFVVGDHGELFGEHGLRDHDYGMYEELIHVPVVALGELVPTGTTEAPTSLLDVHRTLLAAAGLDDAAVDRGERLFDGPLPDDRAVYSESAGCAQYDPDAEGVAGLIPPEWAEEHYALRTSDATLIHNADGITCRDPATGEALPEQQSELDRRVRDLRRSRRDFSTEAEQAPLPDDVAERLEDLGYVQP